MVLPNFLIIGAGKAGTQSVVHYLSQHPSVYMLIGREPSFFALENQALDYRGPTNIEPHINRVAVTELGAYKALFGSVSDETAIGEKSPLYLYHPKAATCIQTYVPDVRLIAILRNPVQRAYSAYLSIKTIGREPLTFEQALLEEARRIEGNWGFEWRYRDVGFYHVQLQRYFDVFARDQIKVYLYEDLTASATTVARDMFRFLDVDDTFIPDTSLRHNVSGIARSAMLDRFLRSKSSSLKRILKQAIPDRTVRQRIRHLLRDVNLYKPSLPPDVRKRLTREYREDILQLQDLIQRDLSEWLR